MSDGTQPQGVPDAPWGDSAPPAPQPGQQLPNEEMSAGGIALPGQAPPPQQPPQQQQPAPGQPPAPEGPPALACHRSWLMGMRPAARQSAPQIDAAGNIIDVGGKEEIIMLPVPSPYACIGAQCSLWREQEGKCLDVVLAETQLAAAQSQLAVNAHAIQGAIVNPAGPADVPVVDEPVETTS